MFEEISQVLQANDSIFQSARNASTDILAVISSFADTVQLGPENQVNYS